MLLLTFWTKIPYSYTGFPGIIQDNLYIKVSWLTNLIPSTVQLCLFHLLVRLCSQTFKLGFSSMWTKYVQMYKLDLEKAEEPEIKLLTFFGSYRKQGNFRKTFTSASLTVLKTLTVWITTNCGKFLKRWEYQTTLPLVGKEYDKAVYCHTVYLIYMQSTSCKMLGWMNHRLESRLLGKILTTPDMQLIPL